MPHRDELEAAQQRIRALEEKVEELEAEKRAPEPVAKEIAKAETRTERRARQRAEAEAARAKTEGAMHEMSAIGERALATHPTTKDALVTVVGGIGATFAVGAANVAIVDAIDDARRLAKKPAFDSSHVAPFVIAAAAVLGVALPRVFHPAPIFRTRSEDNMTYSPGVRLPRAAWAALAAAALVANAVALWLAAA